MLANRVRRHLLKLEREARPGHSAEELQRDDAESSPSFPDETAARKKQRPNPPSETDADLAFLRSKLAEVREMQRKGDISESDYEKIKAHLIQSMYPPATE